VIVTEEEIGKRNGEIGILHMRCHIDVSDDGEVHIVGSRVRGRHQPRLSAREPLQNFGVSAQWEASHD
jgi:hypothetical protein